MFGWFTRLFRRDPDRARRVFRYKDGTRKRSADPVAVERALIDRLGPDWWSAVVKLDDPPPLGVVGVAGDEYWATRQADREKVLAAVDAAFGVTAYADNAGTTGTPTGLTEIERLGLLTGYVLFCSDLVAAARPFVTPQPRASPSGGNPPPSNGAASSSPIPAPA